LRVGVFSTHPIQYQVPLWRALNAEADIDLTVFYFSDQGISGAEDPGFGEAVVWNTPLLEGYASQFLSREPIGKINRCKIVNLDQLLEEKSLDVVILHGYTHRFARQLIRNKRKYDYKVILRGEFTEMPRRSSGLRSLAKRLYLNWFYHYVDHFCPIGKEAKDHLRLYGINENKMTLAPYSVDDALINRSIEKYDRNESRYTLGIEGDDITFIFSGKMVQRKQPLMLAEAILNLSKTHSNITAIFLGLGELAQALSDYLEPILGKRYIAPGFVNQTKLGLYFTAADVFVLPSTYDTWGLVVNESMHYGLPCVVSDRVGSRRDLVTSGETGEIFEFDNVEQLEACLETFIIEPRKAKSMGKKALQRVQGYTIDKTVRGLIDSINMVCDV